MAGTSFSDGAQAVISAMLQSPYFLYRSELGTQAGGAFNLTPFEVATELAYLLTGSTPDDTLLSAADSVAAGSLTLTAMIDQQATRLLRRSSASNATAVMGFMTGWLGLDRLYTTAHDDTVLMMPKTVRDAMNTESQSLILEAFNGGGSLGERAHRRSHLPQQRARDVLRPADDRPHHRPSRACRSPARPRAIPACSRRGPS